MSDGYAIVHADDVEDHYAGHGRPRRVPPAHAPRWAPSSSR